MESPLPKCGTGRRSGFPRHTNSKILSRTDRRISAPYDRPDMLHQGRPHPPFSLPHHHRHKKGHRFGNPRKNKFFPSQEISYHTEPAQWPLRPQRKLKSRSNSSSRAVESRIIVFPGFLSSAGMFGSSEARIPQSRETRNIRSPPYDPGANG